MQQLKEEMLFYHCKEGSYTHVVTFTQKFMLYYYSSFGTFGDLRVFYTIRILDLARIVERIGTAVTDYFLPPVADITITGSSTGTLTNLGSNALSLCSSQCLSQMGCQSFVLDTNDNSCLLFAITRTNENTVISSGTQYYEKDNDLVIIYLILQLYTLF